MITVTTEAIFLLAPGHPVTNVDDAECTAPVPPEVGSDVSGLYRTWRTAENRACGWEHNRAVYLRTGN